MFLARISPADVAEIYTDFQGQDLLDSHRELEGQDHHPADQQPLGQTEVEPISARTTYVYIYIY